MSGQFPAGPQPAYNMSTYNGTGPPGLAQSYGQHFPPGKGDPRSVQNGGPIQPQSPPHGGHLGPHASSGAYPRNFHPPPGPGGRLPQNPVTVPPLTTQFQTLALNDPSKTNITTGLPPTRMGGPPRHNIPASSGHFNGPSSLRSADPPSSYGIGTSGRYTGLPPTNIGHLPLSSVEPPLSNWSQGVPSSVGNSMPPPMGGLSAHSPYGVPLQPSSIGGPMQPSSIGGPLQPSSIGGPMQPSSTGGLMHPSSIGGPLQPSSIGGPMQASSSTGGLMHPSSIGGPMQPSSTGGYMQPPSIAEPMQPSAVGSKPLPSSIGNPQQPSTLGGALPSSNIEHHQYSPATNAGQYQAGFHEQGLPPSQPQHQQQFHPPPTSMYSLQPHPGQSVHQQVHPPQQIGGTYPQQSGVLYPQQTGGPHPQQTGSPYPLSPVQKQLSSPPAAGGQFPGSSPYGQQPIGYPGQEPQPAPPPKQQLHPDQMPSPIQVIEDDKKNHSGVYQTHTRGSVPPLVTTKFVTQDQGNASPRFIRSTMYNVPCTGDILKTSHIPFALAITPFAELGTHEQPLPLIDPGALGPVRCKRCKAYMSPFMQFIDGGKRFQCSFCSVVTDVPNEYFNHLDHTGRRVDCFSRAELCLGSYEFIVSNDYCKNGVLPKEPAFIFMIDVSYNSVKSGLVQLICDKLKSEILVHLPREKGAEESEIRVGFVTYHKVLHFYNVKNSLSIPHMMVVSDLEDMFVPIIDGFLVKLSESEALIDSLLTQIPQEFSESNETEVVLGPVIQAGLDALKSADRPGRLYIFHTGLPVVEAPGKLKNRDDRKLLGTDKEKTILTAQTPFYSKLGTDCVAAGCSVDLFLFPNQYIDVATISDICKVTAGNIFKYSYFQADIDGERFLGDLKTSIKRSQAFDSVLRVRTSTGIRPVNFYGNFYMANTTDVEMASIDSDSSLSVEVKHDDKLSETEGAYIQVAVLYTSVTGQRRLRCHNLSLNCCNQMTDMFKNCELDVLINFFAKQALHSCLSTNPKHVREHITNEVAQILSCYRKNCANPSSSGQLVLPDCMKLLPLYANCIIKNDSISAGSEISTDDRSYLMHLVNRMDVTASNVFFYPRLLPIHNLDSEEFPVAVRCSMTRLDDSGMYILENGLSIFVWVGLKVSVDLLQNIFGVSSVTQIDIDKVQLLHLDNPVSRRICGLITKIREERSRFLKLTIVVQGDKLHPWFEHFLFEDKDMNSGSSYVDYLLHIHNTIRSILN